MLFPLETEFTIVFPTLDMPIPTAYYLHYVHCFLFDVGRGGEKGAACSIVVVIVVVFVVMIMIMIVEVEILHLLGN